jgi:hypothetical protein
MHLFRTRVVHHHIDLPRQTDEKLAKSSVGVATAHRPDLRRLDYETAVHLERHVFVDLRNGQQPLDRTMLAERNPLYV